MDGVGFALREEVVAHHHVEHHALRALPLEVGEEVEIGGLLGDAGQQGRFGLGEVRRGLAEIDLGRGLRPVGQ